MSAQGAFFRTHYGLARRMITSAPYSATVNTTAYSNNLLLPETSLLLTPASITRFNQSALSTGSVTTLFTHVFQKVVPENLDLAGRVIVRAKWEILAASPAGAIGLFYCTVKKSGTVIAGLDTSYAPERALDAAPGTTYDELFVVDVPKTAFAAGSTVDISLSFAVATAAGGNSLGVGLHVDPTTLGNELIVEFQTGEPG